MGNNTFFLALYACLRIFANDLWDMVITKYPFKSFSFGTLVAFVLFATYKLLV